MKKIIAIILAVCILATAGFFTAKHFIDKAENEKEPEPQIGVLARGTTDGNVYDNTFADFTFTKPEEWNFVTDKGIASLVGYDANKVDMVNLEQTLEELPLVYDMVAAGDYFYSSSIFVTYENMMLAIGHEVTNDEYIELLKQKYSEITPTKYEIVNVRETYFGTNPFTRLTISITSPNAKQSETQYLYFKIIDKYVVNVLLNIPQDEDVETYEAMFK